MAERGTDEGLRPVGNAPEHADDRPVNRNPELPDNDPQDPGLGQRGQAAQHEPEFSRIQGSSQSGEGGSSMRTGD